MARFVYAVWYDVDPTVEAEWDKWMNSTHVPDVVDKGGFLGAKRYVLREGGVAKHVTLYEASDYASLRRYLDGPAQALREDYLRHFGEKTRLTRMILEESYSV